MRAPKVKTPESAVLRACLQYLAIRGIVAWRTNSGMAMLPGKGGKLQPVRFGGVKGSPDIHGYLPGGRALYVECKSSVGKLSPDQKAFLERASAAGCLCIVAHSLDDLIAALPKGA